MHQPIRVASCKSSGFQVIVTDTHYSVQRRVITRGGGRDFKKEKANIIIQVPNSMVVLFLQPEFGYLLDRFYKSKPACIYCMVKPWQIETTQTHLIPTLHTLTNIFFVWLQLTPTWLQPRYINQVELETYTFCAVPWFAQLSQLLHWKATLFTVP